MSDGVRNVSDGVRKVSHGIQNQSDGMKKVSDSVRKAALVMVLETQLENCSDGKKHAYFPNYYISKALCNKVICFKVKEIGPGWHP